MESNGSNGFYVDREAGTMQSEHEGSFHGENGRTPTRKLTQTTNGHSTTLEYPIVTEPRVKKSTQIMNKLKGSTEKFFGLEPDTNSKETAWTERRVRLANRSYGGIRPGVPVDSPDGDVQSLPEIYHRKVKPSVARYVAEGLTAFSRKMARIPPTDSPDNRSRSYRPRETWDTDVTDFEAADRRLHDGQVTQQMGGAGLH